MLKKIRIRLLQNGTLQLSRRSVALRADAKDPDRIVWECEHDALATVRFADSSPFEPAGPIRMGTIMTPRPTNSPASYEYTAQDSQGRTSRCTLLVARAGPRPKTETITIAHEVSPMRCRVRRSTDEVIWICPGDSTARIKFEKRSPFQKDEFDVYELTEQPSGAEGEYKYTVYVDERRIDPVIIIDPPP